MEKITARTLGNEGQGIGNLSSGKVFFAEGLLPGEVGVFCETAHPAKFKEKVDDILGIDVEIPERLAAFMKGEKQSVSMTKEFEDFKQFLLQQ